MSNQDREPDMVGRWISSNVGVLVTLLVFGGGGIAGYATLTSDVRSLERTRDERVKLVDGKLATIEVAVAGIPNLVYRVASNEEALKATNQRVDASLSNISARLAEINQALGSLSTQVAVLTQRLEQTSPERRTEVRPTRQ